MSVNQAPFLSIEGAQVFRNNVQVFEDLNWAIHEGEHWIVTGANASGKSTLMEFLAGRHFARTGKVHYHFLESAVAEGASIYTLKRQQIYLATFSDHRSKFRLQDHYYQQRFNAFDNEGMTVRTYLAEFGYDESSVAHQQIMTQTGVDALLDLSRIKLSSGQVRKLLIASAIIKAPRLLILDNAYIGLDQSSRAQFNAMIDQLAADHNMQIILSGHFQELPKCITHRVHMDSMKIAWQGPVGNFTEQKQEHLNLSSFDALKTYYGNKNWPTTINTIFELNEVNVKYGEKAILNQFSWSVKQGEKWALIGPNGSGKSTILSLIFGDHPQVYANQVTLFDQSRKANGSIWDIKRKMGFVSPELHFFFGYNFTCERIALSGFQDAFFILRKPAKDEINVVRQFFDYFEIHHLLDKNFKQVSTGEQRLVLLIRALVKNPPVLLLDEPFQGLDEVHIARARQLLDELLGPEHTLIFITHYKAEIPDCVQHKRTLNSTS
jgi:molybdate transport system ATP-binding protein